MEPDLPPDSPLQHLMVPALAMNGPEICILDSDGSLEDETPTGALSRLAGTVHLICHHVFSITRLFRLADTDRNLALRAMETGHLDVLELFVFVHPARFSLPTAAGLASALGLPPALNAEDDAMNLHRATMALLEDVARQGRDNSRLVRQVNSLARNGWPWAGIILERMAEAGVDTTRGRAGSGLDVWNVLKPHGVFAPRPHPGHEPVTGDEARAALDSLMAEGTSIRAGQGDYAAHVAHIFAPRDESASPHVVLAEAGTGLGKTLGYLAPAHLWARRNNGAVWISTYTRNLQRQIDGETMQMDIDAARRHDKVVIRKGRENYLCLLNFEELAAGARGRSAVLAALVARWAQFSRDGDMIGGDFPAWIAGLFRGNRALGDNGANGVNGGAAMLGLTDRRGECIHSACPHYDKCFIERGIRKARNADIVIANHAFVMSHMALEQAVPGGGSAQKDTGKAGDIGLRLIFDEGHHVFDAADSAFSAHLSARETSELRRWLRGREVRSRRGRSLAERMGDLVEGDDVAMAHLHEALEAARALPGPGWPSRLNDAGPRGAAERFFALVHAQVRARTGPQERFSLETATSPLIEGLGEAATELAGAITRMIMPLKTLAECLRQRLDREADELETNERTRLESAATGIERRARLLLPGWRDMLDALGGATPAHFVDWFSIERHQGRDSDVGLHRHWVDPTRPFAETVLETAHGVALTSATLRDRPPQLADDWRSAELRTGANHLPVPPRRFSHASPFDYARQARIIVVNDLPRNDEQATASAMRVLFEASGGGALGLFTAIHRLRAVYETLAPAMGARGLALYAQHVDPLDTGTLVDMFRAETDACLLGTDALRDGVDVPGHSLRLVVFDRVPWPRGSLLDKARRDAFGGNDWVDMMTRLKLQQAFGRLIRSERDRGVFVMLDRQLPTRLTTAFPPDAPLDRIGLAEAVRQVRAFLNPDSDLNAASR